MVVPFVSTRHLSVAAGAAEAAEASVEVVVAGVEDTLVAVEEDMVEEEEEITPVEVEDGIRSAEVEEEEAMVVAVSTTAVEGSPIKVVGEADTTTRRVVVEEEVAGNPLHPHAIRLEPSLSANATTR